MARYRITVHEPHHAAFTKIKAYWKSHVPGLVAVEATADSISAVVETVDGSPEIGFPAEVVGLTITVEKMEE